MTLPRTRNVLHLYHPHGGLAPWRRCQQLPQQYCWPNHCQQKTLLLLNKSGKRQIPNRPIPFEIIFVPNAFGLDHAALSLVALAPRRGFLQLVFALSGDLRVSHN
jgi:hypothetical protein